jgi:hypothetical protein
MRNTVIALAVAVICLASARWSAAGDFIYGCRSRPACGKVCKLVCDTTTLVAVGYGCECTQICIPGPSQPGCKHCETRCCCDDELQGCRPKIEFCWFDWCACGCARPRTVKVLTKYQAEKEICSYHWEVVDGCNCCCQGPCHCVYKAAPPEANVGDVLEVTPDEQVQLASYVSADGQTAVATSGEMLIPTLAPAGEPASANQADPAPAARAASAEAPKPSTWQRLATFWRSAEEQP